MPARTVVIVAFPGVQSLDVTGPLEVFHGAARVVPGAYAVAVATLDGGPVAATSGLTLGGGLALDAIGEIDTLIVAGGEGTRRAVADRRLVAWLRERAPSARRVASVCTGTFLLAEAGLLDGRRVTTHWASGGELAHAYPAVDVDPEPIFTCDGAFWTSAGVTAGMDLSLAMVEEDLGRDVALILARHLVLFLRRPGGQSQFSAQLTAQLADRDAIRELQQWMVDRPEADLSVEAMAERVAMSPRHFARRFRDEVGATPGRYVERVRVETARRRLEESADPVELIARACGFGSTETMRRAFVRTLGVAPAEYRRRFRSPTPVP
ncbi:MAG TPA: GlxA family transcriptional regulator [Solirubrobacteraceae bacterium]|jgi:transcriptional regulator GlxA family with amidase domain|nr:GlxA family transcriptional regulator [Solirubrobacteraceae bacterium]